MIFVGMHLNHGKRLSNSSSILYNKILGLKTIMVEHLLPSSLQGYGLLYGISGIPIIIGALVVGILFFNSFK